MVDEQLRDRGVRDERVLNAMGTVPRHIFVDPAFQNRAYGDHALPTAEGQTISQPFIIARMLELVQLRPHHRVLEIGTGSGYQTALLTHLVDRVFSVERVRPCFGPLRGGSTSSEHGPGATPWRRLPRLARSSSPMIGSLSLQRRPVFPTLCADSWGNGVVLLSPWAALICNTSRSGSAGPAIAGNTAATASAASSRC